MVMTKFHFMLLYRDRLVGICNLNEKTTYEAPLVSPFLYDVAQFLIVTSKAGERVRGISADTVRGTYWIYTDQSIYELSTENEATDVWGTYLEKGQYDSALEYTRTAGQRDIVTSAQAQAYFDQGRYFQAAHCYSQSSVSFEDVALKFLDVGERDSLRSYLVSRLERTQKGVSRVRARPRTLIHRLCGTGSHAADDAGDVARRVLPQQMQ
jgi:hypothetical protein